MVVVLSEDMRRRRLAEVAVEVEEGNWRPRARPVLVLWVSLLDRRTAVGRRSFRPEPEVETDATLGRREETPGDCSASEL